MLLGMNWGMPTFGGNGTTPTEPVLYSDPIPVNNNVGWDTFGKTVPGVFEGTIPVNPIPDNGYADPEASRPAHGGADRGMVTMPMDYRNANTAIRPVTGWLVCIDGAEKGKDFRLHSDMNYIGRNPGNDVVLANDPTVSRERHAVVAYDARGKMFFFAPANGSSLVRQNGRPVLSTVELKAGDRIEIGEGTYLFVPLCGDDFAW